MARPDSPAPDARRLRAALAGWYASNRRDLPWRRTRDSYAIWVSEVMLQQTTVATVLGYYDRFLAAFPDLLALAEAPEAEVLRSWSGLGYYHRARNLQRAARAVIAAGGSALPESAAALAELPGIGSYTAAAVASIAHGEPRAVIDGNVERVMARLFAIGGDPRRAPAKAAIAAAAHALLDESAPGDWNQAVMELGATLCTPRAPRCADCPVARWCEASRDGTPERYPESAPRRATVAVVRTAFLVRDDARGLLLTRVPPGRPNAGLWELPATTLHGPDSPGAPPARWSAALAARAVRDLEERSALALRAGALRGRVRHAITHHRITTWLVDGVLDGGSVAGDDWRFCALDTAGGEAITGEARKLLRLIE